MLLFFGRDLLFYTMLVSLLMLVGILFIYNSLGSLCLFLSCSNSSWVGGMFCLYGFCLFG